MASLVYLFMNRSLYGDDKNCTPAASPIILSEINLKRYSQKALISVFLTDTT